MVNLCKVAFLSICSSIRLSRGLMPSLFSQYVMSLLSVGMLIVGTGTGAFLHILLSFLLLNNDPAVLFLVAIADRPLGMTRG